MDKELKATIDEGMQAIGEKVGTIIDEKLKPVTDRLALLEESTEKVGVIRRDADGKLVALGKGEAPAFIKDGLTKDSRPLMLTNYLRAMKFGNEAAMKEEREMSWRLRDAGYQAESGSSFLFPMGADLIVDQVDEKGEIRKDNSALRKEIAERLPLRRVDGGEVATLLRRSPELAKAFGMQQKDLSILDDTLGGLLIPGIESSQIIDLLRPLLSVMRAGATEIALPPSGNLALPRLNADPSFVWADPDTTTDQATSNIGTGMVRLLAKSLRGFVTIPNDLIRYSSPSVEMVVRMALAARAAVAEDNAFLEGTGSSLQPKGVIGYPLSTAETPATGKITLHVAGTVATNGDTFTPEDLMKIIGLYFTGLDNEAPTGWIMRPMLWTAIANRRADAVSAADAKGPFLFWTSRGSQGSAIPEALGGYPVFPTTNASNNRVKGSGTNLVYILFGNFRRLIVGRSGAIELAASDQIKFLQDKTVIRAVLRSDSGLAHEESFVFTDTMLEA
jgi:HK97 family phage major capsid protein